MSVGGAERQLIQLCAGLRNNGVDVHVVSAFPGVLDQALADGGAGSIHHLASAHKYDPRVLPRLGVLCRRLKPDIVQSWLTQMDLVVGTTAKMLQIPWILSERSSSANYPPGLLHYVRARLGAAADAIVANSEGGRDYWRNFVREPSRIRLIPNIVPEADIEAAALDIGAHIAADELIVLHVGRFSAEKNLHTLVDAIAIVVRQAPVKAVFCGDGVLRSVIEEKIRSLGIADRLLFTGTVANVWSWMKRAAVCVSASVFEGNPNAVLEAIAAGTPLVVSDIAAHREILSDSTAWMVNPASAQSVADGIIAALSNRPEAIARATRARTIIATRSGKEIASRYYDVYCDVKRVRYREGAA